MPAATPVRLGPAKSLTIGAVLASRPVVGNHVVPPTSTKPSARRTAPHTVLHDQSGPRTARPHRTRFQNEYSRPPTTHPASCHLRAARSHHALPQSHWSFSTTKAWISLTDSVQLRRIE